jgi:hypothetical protein
VSHVRIGERGDQNKIKQEKSEGTKDKEGIRNAGKKRGDEGEGKPQDIDEQKRGGVDIKGALLADCLVEERESGEEREDEDSCRRGQEQREWTATGRA